MTRLRMRGYPKWFPRFVIGSVAALFVTGCLLIPTALFFRLEWDVPWRLVSGAHIAVAVVHVALAFVVLGLIGAIWSVHMRLGWRRHQSRVTGAGLVAIFISLALTGLGLFYIGEAQTWLAATSIIHMVIGIASPFFLAYHIITRPQS
jgi:hypothetical protein